MGIKLENLPVNQKGVVQLNIEHLNKGLYIVKFHTSNLKVSRKIIVE
jgi:hypothetical protein